MKLTKEDKIVILKPKLKAIEASGETTSDSLWKTLGVIASTLLMLIGEE